MAEGVTVPGLEGLDGILNEISSGGKHFEWVRIDQRKVYTNAFIVKDGKVGLSQRPLLCEALYRSVPVGTVGIQKKRFRCA